MTLTIQSTSEYIELVHESMDKTNKAIDYAVNDDNYFAVICDDQREAKNVTVLRFNPVIEKYPIAI